LRPLIDDLVIANMPALQWCAKMFLAIALSYIPKYLPPSILEVCVKRDAELE